MDFEVSLADIATLIIPCCSDLSSLASERCLDVSDDEEEVAPKPRVVAPKRARSAKASKSAQQQCLAFALPPPKEASSQLSGFGLELLTHVLSVMTVTALEFRDDGLHIAGQEGYALLQRSLFDQFVVAPCITADFHLLSLFIATQDKRIELEVTDNALICCNLLRLPTKRSDHIETCRERHAQLASAGCAIATPGLREVLDTCTQLGVTKIAVAYDRQSDRSRVNISADLPSGASLQKTLDPFMVRTEAPKNIFALFTVAKALEAPEPVADFDAEIQCFRLPPKVHYARFSSLPGEVLITFWFVGQSFLLRRLVAT